MILKHEAHKYKQPTPPNKNVLLCNASIKLWLKRVLNLTNVQSFCHIGHTENINTKTQKNTVTNVSYTAVFINIWMTLANISHQKLLDIPDQVFGLYFIILYFCTIWGVVLTKQWEKKNGRTGNTEIKNMTRGPTGHCVLFFCLLFYVCYL